MLKILILSILLLFNGCADSESPVTTSGTTTDGGNNNSGGGGETSTPLEATGWQLVQDQVLCHEPPGTRDDGFMDEHEENQPRREVRCLGFQDFFLYADGRYQTGSSAGVLTPEEFNDLKKAANEVARGLQQPTLPEQDCRREAGVHRSHTIEMTLTDDSVILVYFSDRDVDEVCTRGDRAKAIALKDHVFRLIEKYVPPPQQ